MAIFAASLAPMGVMLWRVQRRLETRHAAAWTASVGGNVLNYTKFVADLVWKRCPIPENDPVLAGHIGKLRITALLAALGWLACILLLTLAARSPHGDGSDFRQQASSQAQPVARSASEPGSCEYKWRSIPASFKRDLAYEDFQKLCETEVYIALCQSGDLGMADTSADVCPGSRVLEWRRVPDA